MNILIAIIGSSAFGAIVSFLFTWITNRRSNSLSYITDERRKWRDKIREIIIGIDNSCYKGKGNKNINMYLNQLEVNINPYGQYSRTDYERDGHVWEEINKLKDVKSDKSFDQDKRLLLKYLRLMLKKDWERSKNEVRGYSYTAFCIGIVAFFVVFYLGFYFYILRLKSIPHVLLYVFLNLLPLFGIKYLFVDEIDVLENSRKRMSIKLMKKKERKAIKIVFRGSFCIVFIVVVNFFIGESYFPKAIEKNMLYCTVDEEIYLYSNLDINLVSGLKDNLQSLVSNKVNLVENQLELPAKHQQKDSNDKILIKAIRNSISFWNALISILTTIVPIVWISFSYKAREETRKYKWEIEKVKSLERYEYGNIFEQIKIFSEKINYKDKKNKEINDTYMGIIYSFLSDIEVFLENEINNQDMQYETFEEYEELINKKKRLEQLRLIMKQIRLMNRTVSYKKKSRNYNNIKKSIDQIQ